MSAPTLHLLGSGGFVPTPQRHTACALIRNGDRVLIIDGGTGMHHLISDPSLLAGAQSVDIILTHFHLDHICGLAYLAALNPGSRAPMTVWGPGALHYGRPSEAILDTVSVEPVHPVSLPQLGIPVHDVPAGEFELAGLSIRHRRQDRHSAPTLGLRIADSVTWVTDTAYDEASADFAAGSKLLFHEAWSHAGATMDEHIHCAGARAAKVAADADVARLVLIHHNPRPGMVLPTLSEARAVFAATHPGCDGDRFCL